MKASVLPTDYNQLKNLFQEEKEQYLKQITLRDSIIQTLQDELAIIKRMKFRKSSEKWTAEDKSQGLLFNESETYCSDSVDAGYPVDQKITYTRKNKGRKPIPADIPREEILYDVDESDKNCPHCHKERPELGSEESEELLVYSGTSHCQKAYP